MRGEQSGALGSLRESNRDKVVQALKALGVGSRAQIARRTGLSRSTVSSIVAELQSDGLVVDREAGGHGATGSGRPPALIALDSSAGLAVGIDFGKRHLAVALADLSHEILAEQWIVMGEDYAADDAMLEAVEARGARARRGRRGSRPGARRGDGHSGPDSRDRRGGLVVDPPGLERPLARGAHGRPARAARARGQRREPRRARRVHVRGGARLPRAWSISSSRPASAPAS